MFFKNIILFTCIITRIYTCIVYYMLLTNVGCMKGSSLALALRPHADTPRERRPSPASMHGVEKCITAYKGLGFIGLYRVSCLGFRV